MKKLPDFVKWLIIAAVLAGMAALMVAVNDRASRVEMPMPDNSLGIYRTTPAAGNCILNRETGLLQSGPVFCIILPRFAYAVRTKLNGWEAWVCLWSH